MRQTAGTQALRAGADLRQVQDLLGHADPRTTSISAHVDDCEGREAYPKVYPLGNPLGLAEGIAGNIIQPQP